MTADEYRRKKEYQRQKIWRANNRAKVNEAQRKRRKRKHCSPRTVFKEECLKRIPGFAVYKLRNQQPELYKAIIATLQILATR
jgi:hypothetical protein